MKHDYKKPKLTSSKGINELKSYQPFAYVIKLHDSIIVADTPPLI